MRLTPKAEYRELPGIVIVVDPYSINAVEARSKKVVHELKKYFESF